VISSALREEFTRLLHEHVPQVRFTGTKVTGCVPWRKDDRPSFSANTDNGTWYDHAKQEGGGVKEFKERIGVNGAKQSYRTIIASYNYTDENGALLYQAVRFEPKGFLQRKPDGNGGWDWKLDGVRRVLYRLPEIAKAETVYVVEGEKDADRLWSLDIPATTNPQGAGKWREEYNTSLAGKQIVIFPDNDEPGEQHALQVARSLLPVAMAVKIVRLPDLPPKGDVTDWLNAGHSKEELCTIVTETPTLSAEDCRQERSTTRSGFSFTKLADLLNEPEENIEWLVEKMLPSGGFSTLVAKPKAGKSTLARNLALVVAQGKTFLDRPTQQGVVIYLALEEKRSEVKRHFREMGATGEEDIYIHTASAPADGLEQIRAIAQEKKPVLIIIDPLFRFTRIKDGNDYAQVTTALEPLLVLARETRAHVLCVHHAGKRDREGGDAILGSTAIFAAVDAALFIKRTERYRTLSSTQRYGEDLSETVLRFDPQSRTVGLGQAKEQEEADRIAEAILACLKAQEDDKEKGHPLTQAELDEEVEGKTTYKRKALKALVDGKHIERLGKGGKKDPFRYCIKDSRFHVPLHSKEYGNKNQKNGASTEEDESYSCSQGSEDFSDPAESWEQEKTQWEEEL